MGNGKVLEIMMELLEQEWVVSKRPCAYVAIQKAKCGKLFQSVVKEVEERHKIMECEDIKPEEYLAENKECFVLLRLGKKIEAAADIVKSDCVLMELDEEEFGCFSELQF